MNNINLDWFQLLTIINSVVLVLLPLVFFRRQKIQEIKYKELMELNIKTHDITQRADRTLQENRTIAKNDWDRLDYLISRYKKHSKNISSELQDYKDTWQYAMNNSESISLDEYERELLKRSKKIRDNADKLLS